MKKVFKEVYKGLYKLLILILRGAGLGLIFEIGVVLFIIALGQKLDLITIVGTYLFSIIISIVIILEVQNTQESN